MIPTKRGKQGRVSTGGLGLDPSAGPKGPHEGLPDTSVDPDTSSFPSRLVLLLSDLSVFKWGFKFIHLHFYSVRQIFPQSIRSCAKFLQLSALRFTICINMIYMYLILKFYQAAKLGLFFTGPDGNLPE